MNGYLRRVASRGLGAQAAPVVPLVRSRSPIAEDDQRVGLPGFGRPSLGNAESIEATLEDTGATAVPQIKTSPPLLNAGTGVVQRKAAGTALTSEFGKPRAADAGAVSGTSRARRPEADIHASDLSPGSTFRINTMVVGRDQPTGFGHAELSRGDFAETAPDTRTGTELKWVEPPWPSPARDVRGGEREEGPQRPAEGASALLEPSPRATLSPALRESMSSEALDSPARPEAEPRVVIGRINVEVVPPAAEPKTSAPSRSGPLTAESVSVIGPLTRGVRSGLRLSLKYR